MINTQQTNKHKKTRNIIIYKQQHIRSTEQKLIDDCSKEIVNFMKKNKIKITER